MDVTSALLLVYNLVNANERRYIITHVRMCKAVCLLLVYYTLVEAPTQDLLKSHTCLTLRCYVLTDVHVWLCTDITTPLNRLLLVYITGCRHHPKSL
jgi:hypothetical protein